MEQILNSSVLGSEMYYGQKFIRKTVRTTGQSYDVPLHKSDTHFKAEAVTKLNQISTLIPKSITDTSLSYLSRAIDVKALAKIITQHYPKANNLKVEKFINSKFNNLMSMFYSDFCRDEGNTEILQSLFFHDYNFYATAIVTEICHSVEKICKMKKLPVNYKVLEYTLRSAFIIRSDSSNFGCVYQTQSWVSKALTVNRKTVKRTWETLAELGLLDYIESTVKFREDEIDLYKTRLKLKVIGVDIDTVNGNLVKIEGLMPESKLLFPRLDFDAIIKILKTFVMPNTEKVLSRCYFQACIDNFIVYLHRVMSDIHKLAPVLRALGFEQETVSKPKPKLVDLVQDFKRTSAGMEILDSFGRNLEEDPVGSRDFTDIDGIYFMQTWLQDFCRGFDTSMRGGVENKSLRIQNLFKSSKTREVLDSYLKLNIKVETRFMDIYKSEQNCFGFYNRFNENKQTGFINQLLFINNMKEFKTYSYLKGHKNDFIKFIKAFDSCHIKTEINVSGLLRKIESEIRNINGYEEVDYKFPLFNVCKFMIRNSSNPVQTLRDLCSAFLVETKSPILMLKNFLRLLQSYNEKFNININADKQEQYNIDVKFGGEAVPA